MTRSTTKKFKRFLAFIMVAVLLATCLPLTVFGANEELLPFDSQTTENTIGEADALSVSENTSVSTDDVIGEYVEDISRREENVKHFALPDGTYTAIVYPAAVHRKDADGAWQDINNDLSLSSVKGSEKFATFDSRVSFSSRFSPSSELMTLSENGYSISMSLLSESKNDITLSAETQTFALASVTNSVKKELPKTDVKLEDVAKVDNKSSIVYNNVRANTDIEYILDGNDVKENIIVKAPLSEYKYSFDLRLGGLVAVLNENGSISINDAQTGAGKYKIPAPYMYDTNGEVSYAVEYTLIEISSDRYLLTVTADKTWINADGREFPVTIDPTVTSSISSYDTYVSDDYPNTNYFSASDFVLNNGDTALMHFNLPTIPSDAVLMSSYVYFHYYFDVCHPEMVTLGAYQITGSWSEEFVTYNSMPTVSNQQLSSVSVYLDELDIGEYGIAQISITDAAYAWYHSNAANYGIAIEYEEGIFDIYIKSYDSGNNYCEFISVNYAYDILDGVYALGSTGFTNRWMTVLNDDTLGQISLTTSPASTFGPTNAGESVRSSLFKITKVGNTNRYVIRSMLDNKMGLGMTAYALDLKELPYSDAAVSITDTFFIVYEYDSWMLIPYESEYGAVGISDVDSPYLSLVYPEETPRNAIWSLNRYGGDNVWGVQESIPTDLVAGKTFTVSATGWSTYAGYNKPELAVHPDYEDNADLDWENKSLTPHLKGELVFKELIRNPDTNDGYFHIIEPYYVEVPFAEGKYYIVNKNHAKYIQINADSEQEYYVQGATMELGDPIDQDYQYWNFVHIVDDYYKIVSSKSGLAISISSDGDLELNVFSADADYMLWKIRSQGKSYFIESKPKENSAVTYYISTQLETIGNDSPSGLPIESVLYSNSNYCKEWYLFRASDNDVVLVGISNIGFDNHESFVGIMSQYSQDTDTGFSVIEDSLISKQKFKSCMENSRIFVSRSHGGSNDDESYIFLKGKDEGYKFYSYDIYNFDTNTTLVDLSGCELIIFVACQSGEPSDASLVDAAIAAGAQSAIGFIADIDENKAKIWTEKFFEQYSLGNTLEYSKNYACDKSGIISDTVYMRQTL